LQKTRLFGAFAQTLRCPTAELLAVHAPYLIQPLGAAGVEPTLDGFLGNALLLQLSADAQRSVTAALTGAYERLDKALIR